MLKIDRKKVLQRLRRVRDAELRRRTHPPRKALQEAARRIKADQKKSERQLAQITKGTLPDDYSHLEQRHLRDYDLKQIGDAINILEVTTSAEVDIHRTPFASIGHLLAFKVGD